MIRKKRVPSSIFGGLIAAAQRTHISPHFKTLNRRAIPGLVCSVAILIGLLTQSEQTTPGGGGIGKALAQTAGDRPGVRPFRSPISVNVDATRHSQDNPAAFKALCSRLMETSGVRPAAIPGDSDSTRPISSAQIRVEPDWYLWAQLNSRCSGGEPLADSTQLQTYAVHSDAGGAVCITNNSGDPAFYILKLKLPKGIFRIEKLSFTPSLPGKSLTATFNDHLAQSLRVSTCAQLRRLEGCDNACVSTVIKPGDLAPGEVAIIRFTDVARAARTSIAELKSELHNLAASTPGPAARLRRIVAEGDPYLSGLTEGSPSSARKRLGCIHRLILVMSQAESLHRNYQSRQTVNAEPGAKTMGALERIQDSLAETSAVITGLVPEIELGPFTQSQPTESGAGASAVTIEAVATVSVRNTGNHSVDSVKLGLDGSALPDGSKCIPDDPAYFGTLHPGQAVRAQFTLRVPESEQPVPARFVADVSYFTSGAPAHLRPRPW
jgi:hypothetical protein